MLRNSLWSDFLNNLQEIKCYPDKKMEDWKTTYTMHVQLCFFWDVIQSSLRSGSVLSLTSNDIYFGCFIVIFFFNVPFKIGAWNYIFWNIWINSTLQCSCAPPVNIIFAGCKSLPVPPIASYTNIKERSRPSLSWVKSWSMYFLRSFVFLYLVKLDLSMCLNFAELR